MEKSIMKKYAQAVVKMGANVQEGQYVYIYASVRQQEFVTEWAEFCDTVKSLGVDEMVGIFQNAVN